MQEEITNSNSQNNTLNSADEIEALKKEIFDLKSQLNRWDEQDIVKQVGLLMAAGLRVAAYRVRNLHSEEKEYGPLQFHMTYNNLVMAVMSEEAAKFFCKFVEDVTNPTLGPK